ncbi:TPA: threonine--tRNA ligase [bacterium]|nr:threonine--tRNA ligase [bacterium]
MAQAVLELFPGTKLGIGPSIEDGFYYDFDLPVPISEDDLPRIEEKMAEIIGQDSLFEKYSITKDEANSLFKDAPYKLELLKEIEDDKVTIYRQGSFVDLCRGPHLPSTGHIKAFKLISIAGAYWRGDEKRPMLTRIYGTSFPTREPLEEYLHRLEEARRRDHRRLGRELGFFNIYEEAGPGLIYYHPYGTILREEISKLLKREHQKRGYLEVVTPHIAKMDLWKTSGHCEFYRENMFFMEVEGSGYVLKPMNCLGHILIYQSRTRSYREMPLRLFELGTVYRYERSGVLHGLLRVRGFTQDDAHIFCQREKLQEEITKVIDFALDMLSLFGFKEYEVYLSTRPEKFVGTPQKWDEAISSLKGALEEHDLLYAIDEGEGVFYGPKIDIKLKDTLGRAWQGPTIQVDFNLPDQFDISYIGPDGARHQPVMIHRVVLGSLERFIGALIEHFSGAFPTWLAPVQILIVPIADRHLPYAKRVEGDLLGREIRVEIDSRNEKIGLKIREGELRKIPYLLIIGDKEAQNQTIALRKRGKGDLGEVKLADFIEKLTREITKRD